MMVISTLVEGRLDEAVAHKIIRSTGGEIGTSYGRKGISYIKEKVDGFNQMAQGVPLLTLVDLADIDIDCPAEVVSQWVPHRNPKMLLRVVVSEIESWLLADRIGIARFLGVRVSQVPYHSEDLDDPKKSLVDLARSSRETMKRDLVPEDPTQNDQGPGYTSTMRSFVYEKWDIEAAAERSESLRRCLSAVRDLVNTASES